MDLDNQSNSLSQPLQHVPSQSTTKVNNVVGVVIPTRPVLYEWEQVDAGRLVAQVDDPKSVNEICCFLLPGAAVPQGSAFGLYYSPPPYQLWSILGYLSPERLSFMVATGWSSKQDVYTQPNVRLGISIEPMDSMVNLAQAETSTRDREKGEFGLKLAENLYRYLVSFTQTTPAGEQIVVPTRVLDTWMEKFKQKYSQDPNFVFKSQS